MTGALTQLILIGKTDARIAEMLTTYVKDAEDDMAAATAWVRNWELATNAGCVPEGAEDAEKKRRIRFR